MKLLVASFVGGFSVAVALFYGSILSVSREAVGLGRALLRRYFSTPR
jgi:hypothetical protein